MPETVDNSKDSDAEQQATDMSIMAEQELDQPEAGVGETSAEMSPLDTGEAPSTLQSPKNANKSSSKYGPYSFSYSFFLYATTFFVL